jgi:ankyrin repeat protein
MELVSILLEGNTEAVANAVASDSFLKLCNQPLANGQHAIHALTNKKCATGVETLVRHGANVNQESEEQGNSLGFTAAHYAAANSCIAVIEVLKEHNADLNHPAADKWTPLHVATFRGQSEMIKKLVEFGADIDCANTEGHTPLLFAVNLGRVRDARFLLKSKASIQLNDPHRDNLLHYALHYRMAQQLKGQYKLPETQLDIAVLLVLSGVRPDEENAEGRPPTHYAVATLPSLPKALSVLFNNAIKLLCAPVEFNYMTLVTVTEEFLVETVGLEEAKAKELVKVMYALETERQSTRRKNNVGTPPPTGAAAAGATLPAGHPAVPVDMTSLVAGDPSGGKCPFLARQAKQQANKRANDNEDERPHCPFSMYTIRKNKVTLILIGIAFLAGYGYGKAGHS